MTKQLPELWRSHFPKSSEEAEAWTPIIRFRALARCVLVVAKTRIEGKWCAYVDAVPGQRHEEEIAGVLATGAKLDEAIARVLFPVFDDIPYAR